MTTRGGGRTSDNGEAEGATFVREEEEEEEEEEELLQIKGEIIGAAGGPSDNDDDNSAGVANEAALEAPPPPRVRDPSGNANDELSVGRRGAQRAEEEGHDDDNAAAPPIADGACDDNGGGDGGKAQLGGATRIGVASKDEAVCRTAVDGAEEEHLRGDDGRGKAAAMKEEPPLDDRSMDVSMEGIPANNNGSGGGGGALNNYILDCHHPAKLCNVINAS